MIDSRPSFTAEHVALRRALHQVLDVPPVFDDPLAIPLAGLDPADLPIDDDETARVSRQRRAFLAARSRYAEDELARAVGAGATQYVVLGAGLDTFAYRNPYERLRVFEVDHPATQAWKRERLDAARIAIPASMTFAAIDFEREALATALSRAGFDAARPAFFSWLGVVAYLRLPAITETLRFVASCAPQTTIVFDYSIPPERLTPRQRARFDLIAARAVAVGEPWRTFFEPAPLEAMLRELGFRRVQDTDADGLNGCYFSGRTDGLAIDGVGRFGHIAKASV